MKKFISVLCMILTIMLIVLGFISPFIIQEYIKIDGLTVTGTRAVNQDVTFSVSASTACNDTLYYRFSVHPDYGSAGYDGTHWSSMTSTEYVSSNSLAYKFSQAGHYIVVVWVVKDTANSNPTGVPIIGWSVQID